MGEGEPATFRFRSLTYVSMRLFQRVPVSDSDSSERMENAERRVSFDYYRWPGIRGIIYPSLPPPPVRYRGTDYLLMSCGKRAAETSLHNCFQIETSYDFVK